jgi:hypothetical protein
MNLLAGILLPSSVLSSPWFTTLLAFVSLNTLIYVGLTLAKLARWPRQVHPARVREARRRAAELPVVGRVVDDLPADGRNQSERSPER